MKKNEEEASKMNVFIFFCWFVVRCIHVSTNEVKKNGIIIIFSMSVIYYYNQSSSPLIMNVIHLKIKIFFIQFPLLLLI